MHECTIYVMVTPACYNTNVLYTVWARGRCTCEVLVLQSCAGGDFIGCQKTDLDHYHTQDPAPYRNGFFARLAVVKEANKGQVGCLRSLNG